MPITRPLSMARHAIAILLTVLAVLTAQGASAQSDYQPSPENLQARREFQDMKFGMFIHWAFTASSAMASGSSTIAS